MSHKIPHNSNNVILKADSGASKSFIREQDAHILKHINVTPGPVVALPDMSILRATKNGTLPIPGLSVNASTAHVLPGLKSTSLLSLGQLCDDGCDVKLTKNKISITKNGTVLASGNRCLTDGHWDIKLPITTTTAPTQHNQTLQLTVMCGF